MSYLDLLPTDIFCDLLGFLTLTESFNLCIAYPINSSQVFQTMKLKSDMLCNNQIYMSVKGNKPMCGKYLHKCSHCDNLYIDSDAHEIYQYQTKIKIKPNKKTYIPGAKKYLLWPCAGACAECLKLINLKNEYKYVSCACCISDS